MALVIMQPVGQALILIGLGAAVGYAVALARSQSALRRTVLDLRREFHTRVQTLEDAVKAASAPPATAPAAVKPLAVLTPVLESKKAAADVSPETLLVIAAAVTAFLGKKVRVRSAKMLQSPYEIINPWAQQGRVFVQASHNLARGRE